MPIFTVTLNKHQTIKVRARLAADRSAYIISDNALKNIKKLTGLNLQDIYHAHDSDSDNYLCIIYERFAVITWSREYLLD